MRAFQPNWICLFLAKGFHRADDKQEAGISLWSDLWIRTWYWQTAKESSHQCALHVWAGECVCTHVCTADFGWLTGLWVRTLQGHRAASRGQSASLMLRCSLEILDRQFCFALSHLHYTLFSLFYIIIKVASELFNVMKIPSLSEENDSP